MRRCAAHLWRARPRARSARSRQPSNCKVNAPRQGRLPWDKVDILSIANLNPGAASCAQAAAAAAPAATGDQPLRRGTAGPCPAGPSAGRPIALGRVLRPTKGSPCPRSRTICLEFHRRASRRWRADPPRSRRRRSAHAPAAMEAGGTSTSASGVRFRARNSKRSAGRQCGEAAHEKWEGAIHEQASTALMCAHHLPQSFASSPSRGARGLSPRCHHCSRSKERHWRCSTPPYSRGRRTPCHCRCRRRSPPLRSRCPPPSVGCRCRAHRTRAAAERT